MPLKTKHKKEPIDSKHENNNGICKVIVAEGLNWPENITVIDISKRKINHMEDNIKFPPNLIDLNISHNNLKELPNAILNLKKLKNLNSSYNEIILFDDTPNFCHSIEILDLSHNGLLGPPYWIWSQSPRNLTKIDLSYNIKIHECLQDFYFNELLGYKCQASYVNISNCRLKHHLKLLDTFCKVKILEIGSENISLIFANNADEVPFEGIYKCSDIERLKLCNVQLRTVNPRIDFFTKLVEIDLSFNYISSLPEEFCKLHNLKSCILSENQLLYLPDGIGQLENLEYLKINNNELCMLPNSIIELKNLLILDLYDNCLYEVPIEIYHVSELDLAQNYFEEPNEETYIVKRDKLRLCLEGRLNGPKVEERSESPKSCLSSDEESSLQSPRSNNFNEIEQKSVLSSSSEDWDSDDVWVPRFTKPSTPPPHSPWLFYIKQKMEEGNFCPMDAHPIPVSEKVKYEKQCQPDILYESDGQFDDFSEDDS